MLLSFSAIAVSPTPPPGSIISSQSVNFNQVTPIPVNGDPAEVFFNVQGVQGQVWDIDLQTFIRYTTPSDLTMILTSPSGKEVTLISHEGKTLQQTNGNDLGGLLNITHDHTLPPDGNNKPAFPFGDFDVQLFDEVLNGTLWDDQAELPVTKAQYSTLEQSQQETLQPEGALDAFRGINPNGLWKLTLIDKTPGTIIKVEGKEVWKWDHMDEYGKPFNIPGGAPPDLLLCQPHKDTKPWATIECIFNYLGSIPQPPTDFYEGFFTAFATSETDLGIAQQKLNQATLNITSITENSPFKWASVTNTVNLAIANNSIVSSSFTTTNLGPNLKDIKLFTKINHDFCADLTITLTSPSEKTILISEGNGQAFDDNFSDTFWDDQSPTPVTDAIFTDAAKFTLIPEGKLASFRGENPNGKWTLTITDKNHGIDNSSGILKEWGLRFISYINPIAPPEAPSIPQAPAEITTTTASFTNAVTSQILNFQSEDILFPVEGLKGSVWNVDLTTFISHSSSADLVLQLIAPSGEAVILSTTNGYQHGPFNQAFLLQQNINQPNNVSPFPFQNFIFPPYENVFNGTLWSDQVALPVKDETFTDSLTHFQLIPEGSLDLFKGVNPNGIWKLTISDARDHQAVGGFQFWLDGAGAFQESVATTAGFITNSILQITTASGSAASKERSFNNTTVKPINHLNSTTSEIKVEELGSIIEQVKVYTKIAHPKSGELDISLTSPSGKTAILTTGNGGENADIFKGTLWNDRAPSNLRVVGMNFVNGQTEPLLIPEGALALFRGENPNGTWTLVIKDTQAGTDGNLEEWGLEIDSYLNSLPPIDGFPSKPKPLPPSNFSKGDAFLFGQKGKVAYLLKQENGKGISAPITLGNLPPKNKIVAANSFILPNQSNETVCLILQNKTQLSAKVVGANGSSLSDASSLKLPELLDRKDKVVATGDLNQDGFIDLVTQGRKKAVKIFLGPTFNLFPFTNDVRKLGKVVGVANGKILTRKKALLYAITPATDTNNFTSTTVLIGSGLKPSLKICGTADILKSPGLEVITQEGNRIGYGPINLNGSFGFLFTNRADLTLGKAVGPK